MLQEERLFDNTAPLSNRAVPAVASEAAKLECDSFHDLQNAYRYGSRLYDQTDALRTITGGAMTSDNLQFTVPRLHRA